MLKVSIDFRNPLAASWKAFCSAFSRTSPRFCWGENWGRAPCQGLKWWSCSIPSPRMASNEKILSVFQNGFLIQNPNPGLFLLWPFQKATEMFLHETPEIVSGKCFLMFRSYVKNNSESFFQFLFSFWFFISGNFLKDQCELSVFLIL